MSDQSIDVAAAWLTNESGDVLICRRASTEPRAGFWEFPGGKFEAGESGVDALVRELNEELRLAVHCGKLLETAEHQYANGRFRIHLFACTKLDDSEPVLTVHDEMAWVAPSDLLSYNLLPGDVPIIKSYLAKVDGLL